MKLCTATMLTLVILPILWVSTAANSPGCQSIEGKESGILRSPNYPSKYGSNQHCSWTLSVEEGYFIRLTFLQPFSLENHASCSYDWIQLIDVDPTTGSNIKSKRLCGNQKPDEHVSSSSTVRFEFGSDTYEEFEGFSAFWTKYGDKVEEHEETPTAPCGFEMEGDKGELNYPGTNANPEHTIGLCSWNISVPYGNVILLEINSTLHDNVLDETDDTCNGNAIQIYDVMSNNSLISRKSWCGIDDPLVMKSFSSQMSVTLDPKFYKNSGRHFSAKWTAVSDCNGVFKTPEGHIMSYHYPEDQSFYGHMAGFLSVHDCTWDIVIPSPYHVVIDFDRQIREDNCRGIQILDYSEDDDDFISRQNWCLLDVTDSNMTSHTHSRVKSQTSMIRLRHRYELYQNDGPFLATWKTECGRTFSTMTGNMSSPGYGEEYPPGQDCEWVIEGVKDHVIRLDFRSPFDIETSNNGTCHYDYVEVFDSNPGADLVSKGRFCGTKIPPRLTSTAEKIVVRFHSDQSKTGEGFSASWDTSCGDVYTSLQGNLTSPGFNSSYPDNFDCTWEIQVPDGHAIQLSFTEPFSLEGNTECDADFLEIYDYTQNGTLSKLGRWCGQNMPPLQTSLTSRMMLVFHSDQVKNYTGFQAQWTSGKNCGRIFDSPNGTFTSPGYPQHYPNNLRCRWEMSAMPGQRLKLEFGTTFDLEMNKDDCGYDGVEVLDTLSNGTLVSYGKWCSVRQIPVFYTTSRLVVLFYSDTGKSGQGFSASWESVSGCDEVSTSMTGHLMSPSYPSNYAEYRECLWTIGSPYDGTHNFTLHFDPEFDLETHPGCEFDYVEIHRANEVVGRWCGSDTPPDITSGGQTLRVIFKSDKSETGKGFFASWN